MRRTRNSKRVAILVALSLLGLVVVVHFLVRYWKDLVTWYELSADFSLVTFRNIQGFPEYRHDQTGIVMVLLPGGEFRMGSPEGTGDYGEAPQHRVTLSPFLIAKFEVSQAEWQRAMGSNPSAFKGEKLPVETVSWNDCQDFCTKTGLSLPSEAQWEYACRAGTTTPYACGDVITPAQANFSPGPPTENDGVKVYPAGYRGKTVSVDAFEPNAFGLYNMHGNVVEWCQDIHNTSYYSSPKAAGPDPVCVTDPPPAPFSSPELRSRARVIRGGNWTSSRETCRSANRYGWEPTTRLHCVGFRPTFQPFDR